MGYKLVRKDGKYVYECKACFETFLKYEQFKLHSHSKLVQLQFATSRIMLVTKELWRCDICHLTFHNGSDFEKHRKRHSQLKIACSQCSKRFRHEHFLKDHVAFVHEKQRNFVCDICDFATVNSSTLQLHVVSKHTKEYTFVCKICGKGYMSKSRFQTHYQSVHEVVQYVCILCGKGFSEKPMLRNHLWWDHREEKPFKCGVCEKSYLQRGSLTRHVRQHTAEKPYKCNSCLSEFVSKTLLNRHTCKERE